ncbi:hypothetical protein BaRGS_00020942 [Batillaria attramentaria]|uniref:Uncharacterized protein n=1 Tax=Batillaria attramentaria TaxID=370345 RepID=A0ABD0KL48_9CAEN
MRAVVQWFFEIIDKVAVNYKCLLLLILGIILKDLDPQISWKIWRLTQWCLPDSPCLQCNEQPSTTTSTTSAPTAAPVRCEPERTGNLSKVMYPPDQEITGAYSITPRNSSEYTTRFDIGQRWILL